MSRTLKPRNGQFLDPKTAVATFFKSPVPSLFDILLNQKPNSTSIEFADNQFRFRFGQKLPAEPNPIGWIGYQNAVKAAVAQSLCFIPEGTCQTHPGNQKKIEDIYIDEKYYSEVAEKMTEYMDIQYKTATSWETVAFIAGEQGPEYHVQLVCGKRAQSMTETPFTIKFAQVVHGLLIMYINRTKHITHFRLEALCRNLATTTYPNWGWTISKTPFSCGELTPEAQELIFQEFQDRGENPMRLCLDNPVTQMKIYEDTRRRFQLSMDAIGSKPIDGTETAADSFADFFLQRPLKRTSKRAKFA